MTRLLPLPLALLVLGCTPKNTDTATTEQDTAIDTVDTSTTEDTGVATTQHECETYSPQNDVTSAGGSWEDSEDEGKHTYTTPSDPGGGILTVGISSSTTGPWVDIDFETTVDGAVASANGTDEEGGGSVAFEVGPGQTYTATTHAWFGPDEWPAEYTLTWSYAGVMDCFEPNNNPDEAKALATNLPVEAHFLANRSSDNTNYDDFQDWYTFETVHENAVIEFDEIPWDIRMGIEVTTTDGLVVASWSGSNVGQFTHLTIEEPGAYTMQLRVLSTEGLNYVINDDLPPDHFTRPYLFTIVDQAEPITDEGATPEPEVECDEDAEPVEVFLDEPGQWASADDATIHVFGTPIGVAGELSVGLLAPDVAPGLYLEYDIEEDSELLAISQAETDELAHIIVEAGGDQVYTAELIPESSATDTWPKDYLLTWSFTERVDCYEPNNTRDVAAVIGVDKVIRAYALAERSSDGTVYDDFTDWYTFTTIEPGMRINLSPPADLRMRYRLYDSFGELVESESGSTYGEWLETTLPAQPPGTYLLELAVLGTETQNIVDDPDDVIPAHFRETYTLSIEQGDLGL